MNRHVGSNALSAHAARVRRGRCGDGGGGAPFRFLFLSLFEEK